MNDNHETKFKIACEILIYKVKAHFEFKHHGNFRKQLMLRLYKRKLIKKYMALENIKLDVKSAS